MFRLEAVGFKTLRIALTPEMYTEVRSILIHDSLPYYETVFENGIQMKKLSLL